ncbi:protein phosphatase 2C domain-containing protein [Streptomyces chrestomyceticus]|uniref:protein phosphatase 2C domain-containing protein n=1 Tax=Streptomyces chrestomyceticus TaxID=68185 RepID=UPI00379B1EAE
MNPQGDRRHHENSWWRELYEEHGEAARDTGPATAPDTLDDRVDSAFRAVNRTPGAGPEPMALPTADPAALDDLVPDTELDGAGYGPLTLRAASLRGEAARRRAEPRGDALLTARFGAGQHALILVAVATAAGGDGGAYAYAGAHRAARDVCRWIGGAVGRSYPRLAEDVRTGDRCALKSGLHRLTDRSYGRLRAYAGEHGLEPEQYTAALRCLLLPADPACRTRVFFGVGAGGFLRLRDGAWQDLEPAPPRDDAAAAGDGPHVTGGGPGATGAGPDAAGQPGDGSAGGEARTREAPGATPPWPVPGDPATDALREGVRRPPDTRPDLRLPSGTRPDLRAPSDTRPDLRLPSDTRPDLRLPSDAGPGTGIAPPGPDPGGTLPGLPRAPSGQQWRPPYESAPRTWPEPFRFRACVTRPGDTLLLCSAGFAGPLTEAAGFAGRLAARWSGGGPPDLASFLADVRLHAEGYGQDRTAVVVWEGRDGAGAEGEG